MTPEPYGVYTLDEVIQMTRSSYHQVARWRDTGLLRPIANNGRAVRFTGRAVISLLDALDPHAIASPAPTTLRLATANTVRSMLKDGRLRPVPHTSRRQLIARAELERFAHDEPPPAVT